jgi:anthranilate phosphoribosyltransferase
VTSYEVSPERFGFEASEPDAIRGGSVADNVRIAEGVLSGQQGATRTITLMNAAAALYASNAASTIEDGISMATESIDSGAAMDKVRELAELTTGMVSRQSVGVS